MIQLTTAFLQKMLANEQLTVTSGDFTGILVGLKTVLFVNAPTLSRDSTFASLVEPGFTGYTQKAITWGLVNQLSDGSLGIDGISQQWQPTGGSPADVVNGYGVILPGTPNVLYWAEYLPAPVSLTSLLAALALSVQLVVGSDNYGSARVIIP